MLGIVPGNVNGEGLDDGDGCRLGRGRCRGRSRSVCRNEYVLGHNLSDSGICRICGNCRGLGSVEVGWGEELLRAGGLWAGGGVRLGRLKSG